MRHATEILQYDEGLSITQLRADVRKAHRRIKYLAKDWRYIAARLGDTVYINRVGTYGIASIQWYWGRLVAAMTRLAYYLIPTLQWIFVFVDDFELLLNQEGARQQAASFLLLMEALGMPFPW